MCWLCGNSNIKEAPKEIQQNTVEMGMKLKAVENQIHLKSKSFNLKDKLKSYNH
jgi:hypothetical protein